VLLVISNGRTAFDVGRLRTGHLAALWTPPFGHFWALRARSRWPSLAATTGRQTEALRYHLVCWYYGWFYGGHAPATEHVTLALCNGERRVQIKDLEITHFSFDLWTSALRIWAIMNTRGISEITRRHRSAARMWGSIPSWDRPLGAARGGWRSWCHCLSSTPALSCLSLCTRNWP
jgi:hypothetical protein